MGRYMRHETSQAKLTTTSFRDKVLENAVRDLSLSVSNTMTASVWGHQAMCQSEKVRNMVSMRPSS
jgi:hypothetical protein